MSGMNGSRRNWGPTGFDLSFDDVRDQVKADDAGKWDHTVSRHELLMRDGFLTFAFDNHGEHLESLHPTQWALRQLCERLGIPAGYFARCPAVL